MRLDDYDFTLPTDRIAQAPARPRDSARLLLPGPPPTDTTIANLPNLVSPGDLLVANDTRVIPAQLTATRGNARIGITLDRPLPDGTWHALARNARRVHPGDTLTFDAGLTATIETRDDDGGLSIRFDRDNNALARALKSIGALALPPYIDRPEGPTEQDRSDYQTIFATNEGAVAAPTAGLHFTPSLLKVLDANGINRATVTLHVGPGTFLPLRADATETHRLHPERGIVTEATIDAITKTRASGGQIIAVGTTTLRILEAAAATGTLIPFDGETDIFIREGHSFRTADRLLTNFHLPGSTLFMLVCAFAGRDRMHAAYQHAIETNYRFYSYGDACLLDRAA